GGAHDVLDALVGRRLALLAGEHRAVGALDADLEAAQARVAQLLEERVVEAVGPHLGAEAHAVRADRTGKTTHSVAIEVEERIAEGDGADAEAGFQATDLGADPFGIALAEARGDAPGAVAAAVRAAARRADRQGRAAQERVAVTRDGEGLPVGKGGRVEVGHLVGPGDPARLEDRGAERLRLAGDHRVGNTRVMLGPRRRVGADDDRANATAAQPLADARLLGGVGDRAQDDGRIARGQRRAGPQIVHAHVVARGAKLRAQVAEHERREDGYSRLGTLEQARA